MPEDNNLQRQIATAMQVSAMGQGDPDCPGCGNGLSMSKTNGQTRVEIPEDFGGGAFDSELIAAVPALDQESFGDKQGGPNPASAAVVRPRSSAADSRLRRATVRQDTPSDSPRRLVVERQFTLATSGAAEVTGLVENGDAAYSDNSDDSTKPEEGEVEDADSVTESDPVTVFSAPGVKKNAGPIVEDKDDADRYNEVKRKARADGPPVEPPKALPCPSSKSQFELTFQWSEAQWVGDWNSFADAEVGAVGAYDAFDEQAALDAASATSVVEATIKGYMQDEVGWECPPDCQLEIELVAMKYSLWYEAKVSEKTDPDTGETFYRAWLVVHHWFNAFFLVWCKEK